MASEGAAHARVVTLPAGCELGWKCAPRLGAVLGDAGSGAAWSALYPQLSVASAVAYLPNQWDRGHTEAFLFRLTAAAEVRVVVATYPWLADASLPGDDKARRLAAALAADVDIHVPDGAPLMAALGSAGYAMVALDADDVELVVPHALMSPAVVSCAQVASFQVSPRIPSTTASAALSLNPAAAPVAFPFAVASDCAALGAALSDAIGPHSECTELRRAVGVPPPPALRK